MGRIIGIDYGRARIGIAASDPMHMLASPKGIVTALKSTQDSAKAVLNEVDDPELFVVGLPLHMSGDESEMSKEVREFAKALESLSGKEVVLFDERLSSAQIDKALKEGSLSRKERKKHIDTLSATLILQSYLDRHV